MLNEKKKNIFVRWYKLTNPHKGYWAGQIISYMTYAVFLTVLAIFAARTINCMYEKDWLNAFINLGLELATIIIRNVAMHIEYYFYNKQIYHIRRNVAQKVYNKILLCENAGMKKLSKEKIINIALNNMSELSEFPDAVAQATSYTMQVAITIITVFIANYMAGLIVAALGVVNFFVFYNFNKKLGKVLLDRHEKKDEIYKSYEKVIDGREVINELKVNDQYQSELVTNVEKFSKAYGRYYTIASYKNNIYYTVWNVVVYAITAFLLYFVSKGGLDITIYLIIVPYIKTCTEKLTNLFDKFSAVENMRVDVDRVNLILGLNDKQLVKYGKLDATNEGYNLGLIDVSCKGGVEEGGTLTSVDISFKMGGINIIKGESGSGKRVIFNLLRRHIKPDEGKVLLDNLDLFDYNEKTFKNHIDFCASHPTFLKGTIEQNLLLANKDFTKVKEACDKVGVTEFIEKLPNGFKTQIEDIDIPGVYFLLGLARAILSNCKTLMIYELPHDTPQEYQNKIIRLLTEFRLDKTIILFTHSDNYDFLADMIYEINNGKVKNIKVNKNKQIRKLTA